MPSFLKNIAILFFLTLPAQAAFQWKAGLGSPIYILKQATSTAAGIEFQIYELRPPERDALRYYSGAALLIASNEIVPQSFGFVGHQILEDRIELGRLVVLDTSGSLWQTEIERGNSNAKWTKIPGRFQALERDADESLSALTKEGEIVQIASDGSVQKAVQWRKSLDKSELHVSSGKWILKNAELLLELSSGEKLKSDLRDLIEGGVQDRKIETLGTDGESLYLRVGPHVFRVYRTGSTISRELVAGDFLNSGIRELGILVGLNTKVSVVQPHNAERNGKRRQDLGAQRNPVDFVGIDAIHEELSVRTTTKMKPPYEIQYSEPIAVTNPHGEILMRKVGYGLPRDPDYRARRLDAIEKDKCKDALLPLKIKL